MKQSIAVTVSKEEMIVLRDHGMLNMARRRTNAIRRQHLAGDSRISTIAVDCYLQGVRDAAQSMGKAELLENNS